MGVDRQVADGLRGVDQKENPALVKFARDFINGLQRTGHVAAVADANEPRARANGVEHVIGSDETRLCIRRREGDLDAALILHCVERAKHGVVIHDG